MYVYIHINFDAACYVFLSLVEYLATLLKLNYYG